MRFALIALALVPPAAIAQPSPSFQLGSLVWVGPCSTAFPEMATPLANAVAEFKERVRDTVPNEVWNLLIAEGRKNLAATGKQTDQVDCEHLLESLVQKRLDAALVLHQEDLHLEERATRIRAAQLGVVNTIGVRFRSDTLAATVEEVRQDSPASRAGIRPGDVLVEIGGTPIARVSYARLAILEAPLGASVPITVARENRRHHFNVVLEASSGQRSPR